MCNHKTRSLRINFANFKTFETKQPIAIIQGDAVPSPADGKTVDELKTNIHSGMGFR
jgi:hypothetical protein